MPSVIWSRFIDGWRPDLVLGEDRILLSYATSSSETVAELICFDLDGCVRWSRPGWMVMQSLPGDRFLVSIPGDGPSVINCEGDALRRSGLREVDRAKQHGDLLLFAKQRHVWATDLELRTLWHAAWPGPSEPSIECLVDDSLYWMDQYGLNRWQRGEQPGTLRLPQDVISGAMDEHERVTGSSALAGWYSTAGMAGSRAFQMADRPFSYYWRVSFDAVSHRFLLANATGPHLLLCLERSGQPLWCRYINHACCGGIPYRLPSGLLVASSGCGGILSWLDSEGNILFQSTPHEGVGLATTYTSDVRVLSDGGCLADGGPGIVAYDEKGQQRWAYKRQFCHLDVDAGRQLIAGCFWEPSGSDGRPRVCLELLHGL